MKTLTIKQKFYGAQVTLLVGDQGVGKTFYALNHPLVSEGIFLDLEDRYKETLKWHPEIEIKRWNGKEELTTKQYVMCVEYTEDYKIDRVKSFQNLVEIIPKVIKAKPKLIVIDGIQDVRQYAKENHEKETGKVAYGYKMWGKINNDVRDVLYRTFNYARIKDIMVIITTHFAPDYDPDVKEGEMAKVIGIKIDAKEYILNRVDEILQFKRKGLRFYMQRGKSPRGPTKWMDWTGELIDNDDDEEEEENEQQ